MKRNKRIQQAELCRSESGRKEVASSTNRLTQTLTLIVEFVTLTGLIAAILVLLVIAVSATTLVPATQHLHALADS